MKMNPINTNDLPLQRKRILMAVTTDVVSDMRVRKVADFLQNKNLSVEIIGRKTHQTFSAIFDFKVTLLHLLFNRGPFFYLEYNFRFFMYGLFKRIDLLVANDLDTLFACSLLARLKGVPLVYDSHEYFTESVGLVNRPLVKKIWEYIEKRTLPKVSQAYTVSPKIAEIYEQKYGVKFSLVRNFPASEINFTPVKFDVDSTMKVILYQGVFNPGRNLEKVIEAMQYVDGAVFALIGYGELEQKLIALTRKFQVEDKVLFMGKMPYDEMMQYTHVADLGIALEYDYSPSFKYSLPNKVFDYSLAELPFITLATPEVERILREHEVGIRICFDSSRELAEKMQATLNNLSLLEKTKEIQRRAAKIYTWENECKTLMNIYREYI